MRETTYKKVMILLGVWHCPRIESDVYENRFVGKPVSQQLRFARFKLNLFRNAQWYFTHRYVFKIETTN